MTGINELKLGLLGVFVNPIKKQLPRLTNNQRATCLIRLSTLVSLYLMSLLKLEYTCGKMLKIFYSLISGIRCTS